MKRFTETQKWDDPWFRKLRPEMKLLWQWLLDRCDNAGIIDCDLDLASFHIGYQYPMDTLLEFGERVQLLPSGKHFIPKFIPFQYGKISPDCKAHNPVFQSLEKHGLEGYPKGIHTLQEKEKDTDTEKVTDSQSASAPETKPLCTLEQALAQAPMARMTPKAAEHWWHTRNASGWTKGSTGGGAPRRITSWQSDMATSRDWAEDASAKARQQKSPDGKPIARL